MSPSLIESILGHASGVSKEKDRYAIAEGHKASFYIAQSGQTTAITKVIGASFKEGFVEIETEEGVFHYFAIDSVAGFAVRPPRENEPRRTGFG